MLDTKVDGVNRQNEIINNTQNQVTTQNQETQPVVVADNNKDSQIGNKLFGGDLLKFQLNAFLDAPAKNPPPPNPDPAKVDDAVKLIKDRLSEGVLDWDVTHGDLKDIENKIKTLTPEELNATVDKLSNDDLQKWTNELNGINGSYSGAEKKALFDHLAKNLSGKNLARFAEAIKSHEEGRLVENSDVQALADSVARNASSATKQEFINSLAGKIEKEEKYALAVAQVLGSMKNDPAALETALKGLSDSQLKSVMKAASQEDIKSNYGGNSARLTFNPEPLVKLLDAVSSIKDPTQKARVFEAAAGQMKDISEAGNPLVIAYNKDEAAKQVRDALTKLIDSDPNGVVRELKENYYDGKGITNYLKGMLNGSEQDRAKVADTLAHLLKGNDLKGAPMEIFSRETTGTDGKPFRQNAETIGYFSGGILAATKQITSDRSKQADIFKNVFGTIAGAAGAANPAAGVSAAIINGLTADIVNRVVDKLNTGTTDANQALIELVVPRDAQGNIYRGEAKGDFINYMDHVVLANQP